MTDEEADKEIGIEKGTRFYLVGQHAWAGHSGEYIGCRGTIFGHRPVLKLDNGQECFVMEPSDWKPERRGYADRTAKKLKRQATASASAPSQ